MHIDDIGKNSCLHFLLWMLEFDLARLSLLLQPRWYLISLHHRYPHNALDLRVEQCNLTPPPRLKRGRDIHIYTYRYINRHREREREREKEVDR